LWVLYIFILSWQGLVNHERFIREKQNKTKQNKTKQNRKKYLKRVFGGSSIIIYNTNLENYQGVNTEQNIKNINENIEELKEIYKTFKKDFDNIDEMNKIIIENQNRRSNQDSNQDLLEKMQVVNYETLKEYQSELKQKLQKYRFLVYENNEFDETTNTFSIKKPVEHDATYIPQIIDDLQSILDNTAGVLNMIEIQKN